MCNMQEKVCLVIPCYNEAERLDFSKFSKADNYFLFVNDGSTDNTLEVLNKNKTKNMFVLSIEKNVGKAEAVRQGMNYIKELPIFEDLQWVGYWDADLSTPLDELRVFFLYKNILGYDVDSVWGSRVLRLGSKIKRTTIRHILGRIFATAIRIALKVESYDSQCGAKIFKKEIIDTAFKEKFISRWIFDVEIMLRLNQYKLIECPLNKWEDVKGSKIKFCPVALRTIKEIIKIKKTYKDIIK